MYRCNNQKSTEYAAYGGRGIAVCDRWQAFYNFYSDMGPRPSSKHSIDRIDNDGPYSPENCRWATQSQQNSNRRNTRFVEYEGQTTTVSALARTLGMTRQALYGGMKRHQGSVQKYLHSRQAWCDLHVAIKDRKLAGF
jgi:hypothetical protein